MTASVRVYEQPAGVFPRAVLEQVAAETLCDLVERRGVTYVTAPTEGRLRDFKRLLLHAVLR